MVAQAPRTRTRKPAPPVTIAVVDVRAGLYSALASSGQEWYAVDVAAITCTCKAGQDNFSRCKHVAWCKHMTAAKTVARALAGMTPAARAAVLRCTPVVHVKVDVVLARAAAPQQQPADLAA